MEEMLQIWECKAALAIFFVSPHTGLRKLSKSVAVEHGPKILWLTT